MPKYETKQRKTLLEFLSANADKPLSAADVVSGLKNSCISASAVYRNLSALEKEGKVQRLTVGGSNKVYYRYTVAKGCKRHLHLSCSKCGKTFHMDVPASDSLIKEVYDSSDFKIDSASTVLYGVCGKCGG